MAVSQLIPAAVAMLLSTAALAGDLPDPALTPGDVNPSLTKQAICDAAFTTRPFRSLSRWVRLRTYARYHAVNHFGECAGRGGCEIDHLIPLELGGSNDIKILWPQPVSAQPWNTRRKDDLENRLRFLVCTNAIPLEDAQKEIANDWTDAYQAHIGSPP